MRAEFFSIANGKLKGGAFQMAEENLEIIGVDVGVLRRPFEEILRMLDDVLIERRARGYQHSQGRRLPTPGAAGALPGRRNGSRIARHNDSVQRSDIDAQFESVRGNHGADFAIAQLAFDLATLTGQIAATITAHGIARQGSALNGVAQI